MSFSSASSLTELLRPFLPADTRSQADLLIQLEQIVERMDTHFSVDQQRQLHQCLTNDAVLAEQWLRASLGSQYIVEGYCRDPELLFQFLLSDAANTALSSARIRDMIDQACAQCDSEAAFNQVLRRLRRRLMVMIVWRDLTGLSSFSELCTSMTIMAESCIQQAVDFHYQVLTAKHGFPIGSDSGLPQPLLVLGMGKLGGEELNVSSDIDLIFTFPESGQTDHVQRPLDNQQFFTRLGQRVIKSLGDITVDGFVFRVDMRLRPYGESGALVSNFASLEGYYYTQGREWERFAAIKARTVACTTLPDSHCQSDSPLSVVAAFQEQLTHILQPFIYRKYIDFSVIEALRKLKALIVQEVRRKGMGDNIKLGAGGIRELEFIVQSFQLIRGGRHTLLQQRHWLDVLEQLCEDQTIEEETVEQLKEAYLFLRNTEHAIQAYQDSQTQSLPVDTLAQHTLAWRMGFTTWDAFLVALQAHRQCVSEQFQLVIADPKDKSIQQTIDNDWLLLWHNTLDSSEAFLGKQGCTNTAEVLVHIERLRDSWSVKCLSATARSALDNLIPQLLVTVTELDEPDVTLTRLLVWLEKIVGRSSYITLLLENPSVLRHLAVLFQGSVWIAQLLAQMPSLLDELLDIESLYDLPTKQVLRDELRQQLLRIDSDDLEAHMEVLRYFKLSHSLRVAASELAGGLRLMNVSDYLTWIAEVVLEQVAIVAWRLLVGKHGLPSDISNDDAETLNLQQGACSTESLCALTPGFLVVGYGKMGGIELSYSSDLDLVFLYQANSQGMTGGEKSIDNQTFYTRVGQKIIHILNTRTLSGPLYEVDMRLRPSGNSGLLVSSMAAFERYQANDAWTWEHQALVRARPIIGDLALVDQFQQLRQDIVSQPRDLQKLRIDVIAMRQKMRDHLGARSSHVAKKQKNTEKSPLFHLKQDAGGIVDIEFMVQYAVLAWSHQQVDGKVGVEKGLSYYTDNVRILESLQSSGIVREEQAQMLIEVYLRYREVSHRLALQQRSSLIEESEFAEYRLPELRQQVQRLWQQLLAIDE